MIEKISDKLAKHISSNDEIKEEVCKYGLELIISTTIILVTILILSLLFNCLIGSATFIVFFYILRKFAGGKHSNTYLGCFIMSTIICVLSAALSKQISVNLFSMLFIVTAMVSLYIIFKYAPVGHINKPLNSFDLQKYKKLSRITLIFELTLIFMISVLFPDLSNIYNTAIIAVLIESITLIKFREGKNMYEKIIIHEKN